MSLKGAREKKGVTQGKLSEPTGINLIMLSDYERGTKEPTLETMVKLEKEYKAGIARAQRKRVFPTLFPCLFHFLNNLFVKIIYCIAFEIQCL